MWERLTSWLDQISLPFLAVLAGLMAMAPWPAGEMPHLVQKIQMLMDGNLTRPIDIFDLFAHGFPLVLLAVKAVRVVSLDEEADEVEQTGG